MRAIRTLRRRGGIALAVLLGAVLGGCVYAPPGPPAPVAYAPAPGYAYYYPAPAYYYPAPVFGSVSFFFGGHRHFR